jgi:hypothetical protein
MKMKTFFLFGFLLFSWHHLGKPVGHFGKAAAKAVYRTVV